MQFNFLSTIMFFYKSNSLVKVKDKAEFQARESGWEVSVDKSSRKMKFIRDPWSCKEMLYLPKIHPSIFIFKFLLKLNLFIKT